MPTLVALLLALTSPALAADSYPLDTESRIVPARGRLRCPHVDLIWYKGAVIPYWGKVRVHPAFAERLRRFEEVARDVGIEVYGRAPRFIKHIGTYNCRRIGAWPILLSEHAFGNGIDVTGFVFGKARAPLPPDLPKAFANGFTVSVKRHFGATKGAAEVHARFLLLLAHRLNERPDIFRILLGPAYPGHKGHFHFDCAPWRKTHVW